MTVATVRLLAADPEYHDRAATTGDGATTEFRVPHSPVVSGSVTVTVAGAAQVEGVNFTFDLPTGLCTFLAGSVPALLADVVITYRHTLLSDADLAALLTLEGNDVRLAAAQALDIIASSEALVSKKIELLDLKTDGPAVAKALRDHAQRLRAQAAAAVGEVAAIDWAEIVVDDFSARDRILAEALRNA
jgi:hypothetical protein